MNPDPTTATAATRKATGGQTRELIERRYLQGARWERQPVLEAGLADLGKDEIFDTAWIASEKRGWRFRDQSDPMMILEDLNLVDHGRLTNAAVVLFAKEAGHIFPQSHVRLTAYRTDKVASEFQEDLVSRGHLFDHLKTYDAFIGQHVAVMSDFTATSREPLGSNAESVRNGT